MPIANTLLKSGRSSRPRDTPPARAVVLDEGVPPHGGRGGPGHGKHLGGAVLLAAMGRPTCCNS